MSQRNRNIILWVVAIGLLVSMVISFTPGNLFGNGQQEAADGPVALSVNGEPIRELEIARLEQNPPFNAVQEGPAAQDLQLVLLDQLVSQTVLQQAAADVEVSSAEVRTRVNEFREQQGVAGGRNDRAYQNLLAGAGYTDGTFRELTRQQLQQEKYLDNLTTDAAPTDEEIQTYYEANQSSYQSEPRITARDIVVADKDKADALYAQALTGADFAALARENSTERAEQGGALGAAEGESAPQPVTSVALPTAVSQAAFALQGSGLTAPVQAGGVYHIVKVEAYTPAGTRPLDEVRSEVETDLTDLRKAAAEEQTLRTLKAAADISSPAGSSYSYKNPVVARVGDAEIDEVELDRNTYLNPQIQQLLNPNFADIIASSVKPNVLTQLIDAELAVQGAKTLGGTFVGPDSAVAQSALGYVSRNVTVNAAQVQSFYRENRANYTEQPSALTTRVDFPNAASARDFRQALTTADTISAESINIAAEAAGGAAEDLGTVAPGGQPEEIDTVLFNFEQGMTALGQSGFDISRVLTVPVPVATESGGSASGGAASGGTVSGGTASGGTASGGAAPATQEKFVVLVAARTPERVRPLEEVRAQVRQAALRQRRNDRQQEWLDGLREQFPVENLLASAAAAAGEQSGGTVSGGAASGGTESGGAVSTTPNNTTQSGGPILTPTPVPTPESGGTQDEGAVNEGAGEDAPSANQPDNQDVQGEATQSGTTRQGSNSGANAPAESQNKATQTGTQNNNAQANDKQDNDVQGSDTQTQDTQTQDAQGATPGQAGGAQQDGEQNGSQNSSAQDSPVQNNAASDKTPPANATPETSGQSEEQTGTAPQGNNINSTPQKNNAQGQGAQSGDTQSSGAEQTQPETQSDNPQNGVGNGGTAPKPAPSAPQNGNAN